MMLHIQNADYVPLGQVVCLHLPDKEPEPDLAKEEENPWARVLYSGSLEQCFYACKRDGRAYDSSRVEGARVPVRLNPPPGTHFIPVAQYGWDEVQAKGRGMFVVYSPYGYPLARGRDDRHRRNVGTVYPWLYYDALAGQLKQGSLSFGREASSVMLKEFATDVGCHVDELVFVPVNDD